MRTVCMTLILALATAASGAPATEGGWTLVFKDDFGGPNPKAPEARGIGPKWVPLRGDWYVNREGRLRTQRIWPSDSAIMLDLPLRGVNVRAEMDVVVGPNDTLMPCLQAGEMLWGGGGIRDAVGPRLFGGKASDARTKNDVTGEPLKPHHIVITLEDGVRRIEVDGKVVDAGKTPQGRSLVNCRFGIFALPNGEVDNLRIYTRPLAKGTPLVRLNTEEENRRATVYARDDPTAPDHGFQKAIDSLPASGGAVILPEGRFLMRRHLRLRSHVTLRGQGAGRTVLVACDTAVSPIVSSASKDGVHTVTLKDASAFRVGDAVCFGGRWAHPGAVGVTGEGNLGVIVTARKGNTLALTEPAPPKVRQLSLFFPLVFARAEEFVEIKDLTLIGPEKNPAKLSGGFQTNLITLGTCYGSRVTRVEGVRFPGDGISMQGGADAIVTDNTIRGTVQGFHPGTTTLRYLWSRNLSVDNRLGLFFCWYNSNGVYTRSTYCGMGGYPDAGDLFNIIAFNRDTRGMRFSNGASGVYFGNRCSDIFINSQGQPSRHLYSAAPRYFVVAANVCAKVSMGKKLDPDGAPPGGNVIASNRTAHGKPSALEVIEKENIVSAEGPTDIPGIGAGCGRDKPVPPPTLPEPVLDGRRYYVHGAPDCGFQKALDELKAKGGGTLRLPAGRYLLRKPLNVPSNTVLCGQGMATVFVLLPTADGYRPPPAVWTSGTKNVVIRELAVEGPFVPLLMDYERSAILARDAEGVQIASVDVRGRTAGMGILSLESRGLLIEDCRVVECGMGVVVLESDNVTLRSNIAVGSTTREAPLGHGFWVYSVSGTLVVEGNISGRNAAYGYSVRKAESLLFVGNNSHLNGDAGIVLKSAVTGATIAGNLVMNNEIGISIGEGCARNRILYNRCGDDRIAPRQTVGILEKPGASQNVIMYNTTAPHHGDNRQTIRSEGKDSKVEANWQETLLPSGSSIEEWQQGSAAK